LSSRWPTESPRTSSATAGFRPTIPWPARSSSPGRACRAERRRPTLTGGGGSGRVFLSWTAVDGATGYKVYRGAASGSWDLLKTITGATTTYNDVNTGSAGDGTTDGTKHPPTTDTGSGIAIGVAVDVAVITTKAYLAHNASLKATSVTVETTAPAQSSFKATAISGAGGSSVGVAGSIAVNVVVSDTTSDAEGANPVGPERCRPLADRRVEPGQ